MRLLRIMRPVYQLVLRIKWQNMLGPLGQAFVKLIHSEHHFQSFTHAHTHMHARTCVHACTLENIYTDLFHPIRILYHESIYLLFLQCALSSVIFHINCISQHSSEYVFLCLHIHPQFTNPWWFPLTLN